MAIRNILILSVSESDVCIKTVTVLKGIKDTRQSANKRTNMKMTESGRSVETETMKQRTESIFNDPPSDSRSWVCVAKHINSQGTEMAYLAH